MCGIVGLVSNNRNEEFHRAIDVIAHRGPDAGAVQCYQYESSHVYFGHRRLSILDLTNGANQPFSSKCGRYKLIFNGEIYNHVELRNQLSSGGVCFSTRSDTEVLLNGMITQSHDFIAKMNGMFAFAFLDLKFGKLTLARDPFGIKPLYYHQSREKTLTFASELKSIAALVEQDLSPDRDLFTEFFLNGFLYEPNSGYKNISKVRPGHFLEIDLLKRTITENEYYESAGLDNQNKSIADVLIDQVNLEVLSDVKTGLFFSGGIDSSVLAASSHTRLEALYVEYGQENIGDSRYVDLVADELDLDVQRVHHVIDSATPQNIVDEFNIVAKGTEEPVSDYTYIATRAISRQARQLGYKVMLSGMGGDEFFAGYPRHLIASKWHLTKRIGPSLSHLAGILKYAPSWQKRSSRLSSFLTAKTFPEAYTSLVGYFSREEVETMLGSHNDSVNFYERINEVLNPVRDQSPLRQALRLDRFGYLSHNLTVTDRASMAESIEVRVPLVSSAIDKFSRTIPDSQMLKFSTGKLPLKKFLSDKLPANLISRPKTGFNPPLDARIEKLGPGICTELICTKQMSTQIDMAFCRKLIDDHFNHRSNNTYKIWQLVYFSLWLNTDLMKASKS